MRVAGAALAGLLAVSAQASNIAVTFNGIVSSGADTNNLFGLSGGDMTGQNYNIVYSLDSSIMHIGGTGGADSGSYHDMSLGGSQPSLTATVTINNIAQTFASTYYTAETRQLLSGTTQVLILALYQSGSQYITQQVYGDGMYASLDPTSDFAYTFQGGDTRFGTFNIGGESFQMSAANVTQTSAEASAVPEPATWGLMLIGFGAIGVSLRGRRSGANNALADRHRIG